MTRKNTPGPVETPSFAVGRKVYVQMGKRKRLARVVEDRGAIGRGGRRLLRVTFAGDADAIEQSFEIPAAEGHPRKSDDPGTG